MKKTILITFLFIFSVTLAGCQLQVSREEITEPAEESIDAGSMADKEDEAEDGSIEVKTDEEEDESEEVKIEAEVLTPEISEVKTDLGVIEREIYVYYSNIKEDPQMLDCSKVYSLKRELVNTSEHEEVNALITLTLPLSNEDVGLGFATNLPEGTQLISLKIDGDGTAYADFTRQLNSGGGSCSMLARRAQIEKTLLQFPDIKEVVISVDGQTEDILQP